MISENVENKPENEALIINLSVIEGVHTVSMIVMVIYLIFEEFQPWFVPLSFWNNGIFSMTDWSQMFTDLSFAATAIENFFTETYGTRIESA